MNWSVIERENKNRTKILDTFNDFFLFGSESTKIKDEDISYINVQDIRT